MKILCKSKIDDKDKKLDILRTKVKQKSLYAICYGIRGPKSTDYVEDLDDGLFWASDADEYRKKVQLYVGDNEETKFTFYTIYNRSQNSYINASVDSAIADLLIQKFIEEYAENYDPADLASMIMKWLPVDDALDFIKEYESDLYDEIINVGD